MTEHFHFSKQTMLSTWCLRMYWMPLWCWWEAKPFGDREIESKNCLSKPGSRVRSFQCVADPAAGSSQCCAHGCCGSPVPPSRVCKCLCLQGEGALRITAMGMTSFFSRNWLSRCSSVLLLSWIYNSVMVCFGTQWSFAPYLKSCGKPNSIELIEKKKINSTATFLYPKRSCG